MTEEVLMWRALAIAWLSLGLPGATQADDPASEKRACLSYGDTAEVVSSRKVIAPGAAMVAARHAVPDGDIVRASLCGTTNALVYRLTAIRSDGRVVRVTVDAPSGKVQAVH